MADNIIIPFVNGAGPAATTTAATTTASAASNTAVANWWDSILSNPGDTLSGLADVVSAFKNGSYQGGGGGSLGMGAGAGGSDGNDTGGGNTWLYIGGALLLIAVLIFALRK